MLGFRELIIPVLVSAFFAGVLVFVGYSIGRTVKQAFSPEARLIKLDELRASGKITPAEYERQRASIISRV